MNILSAVNNKIVETAKVKYLFIKGPRHALRKSEPRQVLQLHFSLRSPTGVRGGRGKKKCYLHSGNKNSDLGLLGTTTSGEAREPITSRRATSPSTNSRINTCRLWWKGRCYRLESGKEGKPISHYAVPHLLFLKFRNVNFCVSYVLVEILTFVFLMFRKKR